VGKTIDKERWVFTAAELISPNNCKGHDIFVSYCPAMKKEDTRLKWWRERGIQIERRGKVISVYGDGTCGVSKHEIHLVENEGDHTLTRLDTQEKAECWLDVWIDKEGNFLRFSKQIEVAELRAKNTANHPDYRMYIVNVCYAALSAFTRLKLSRTDDCTISVSKDKRCYNIIIDDFHDDIWSGDPMPQVMMDNIPRSHVKLLEVCLAAMYANDVCRAAVNSLTTGGDRNNSEAIFRFGKTPIVLKVR
jgi:hypothetical protein